MEIKKVDSNKNMYPKIEQINNKKLQSNIPKR